MVDADKHEDAGITGYTLTMSMLTCHLEAKTVYALSGAIPFEHSINITNTLHTDSVNEACATGALAQNTPGAHARGQGSMCATGARKPATNMKEDAPMGDKSDFPLRAPPCDARSGGDRREIGAHGPDDIGTRSSATPRTNPSATPRTRPSATPRTRPRTASYSLTRT
jgi:hypothetical protein